MSQIHGSWRDMNMIKARCECCVIAIDSIMELLWSTFSLFKYDSAHPFVFWQWLLVMLLINKKLEINQF